MTLNGETVKIKVVNLQKLWNFIVYDFYLKSYSQRKISLNFIKFEIQICKWLWIEETSKKKVVDLKKLWNFVLPPFEIVGHFGFSKFMDIIMHLDIHYI
jgi:hypothetical protein